MIDITKETLIEFGEAARRLPRNGKGRFVHVHTIARWTTAGIQGVKLESVRIGGRRVTSAEAIQRFMRELTEATEAGDSNNPSRSSGALAGVRDRLASKGMIGE